MIMAEERTQWNVSQLLKEPIGATRTFDVLATVLQAEAERDPGGPAGRPGLDAAHQSRCAGRGRAGWLGDGRRVAAVCGP